MARPSTVKVVASDAGRCRRARVSWCARPRRHERPRRRRHELDLGQGADRMAHNDVEWYSSIPSSTSPCCACRDSSGRRSSLDPNLVGRGAKAVVIGYPEGGPFTVDRAGVPVRDSRYRPRHLRPAADGHAPCTRCRPLCVPATPAGLSSSRRRRHRSRLLGLAHQSRHRLRTRLPGVLQRVQKAEALPPPRRQHRELLRRWRRRTPRGIAEASAMM